MNRAETRPLARSCTFRRTAVAASVAACFGITAPAFANPTGASVASGSASFASSGNALTVTNSANAIINWQSFSIGVNEITRFVQPSAASAVLNRVVGSGGAIPQSVIDGILSSNGNVFLLNPSGVIFGATSRIDVGGMLASSLNLSNEDFLNGKMRFSEVPGAGSVINNGVIDAASGGRVFLVGPDVQNAGVIRSPQGQIVLAAGKSVELFSENTPFVTVKVTADTEKAINLGSLVSDSGKIGVFGALVRNTGIVAANSVVTGANGEIRLVATKDLTLEAGSRISANGVSGGKVLLQAQGGTNRVEGTVEAKGTAGNGGEVQALGLRVGVVGHGVIDASGAQGGGSVLVGGDYQGKNGEVQNADRTYIGPDGVIRADATQTGDGGRVIVWADGDTRFLGNISARGGNQAGNGGFVETSGKQSLAALGSVDTTAPRGTGGTWFLDPANITIENGANLSAADDVNFYGGFLAYGDLGTSNSILSNGSLAYAMLNNGAVEIQATNDITFHAGLNTAAAPGSFTARAGNNINLFAYSLITNGDLNLYANDASVNPSAAGGSIAGNGSVATNGGNFTASGFAISLGAINTAGSSIKGGNVNLSASGDVSTASITTLSQDPSSSAGWVSVSTIDGRINVAGDIDASGAAGNSSLSAASRGGSVSLTRTGVSSITGDAITVSGNIRTYGGSPYSLSGDDGGDGGDVTLSTMGGDSLAHGGVRVTGSIDTHGGDASATIYGGDGGWGGMVRLTGEQISVGGTISTYGGNAGSAQGDSGYEGGFGGHGGLVALDATTGSVTAGDIFAYGGSGGRGADGGTMYSGTRGGDGGEGSGVAITAATTIATGGIYSYGGSAGNGGAGTLAGSYAGDGGEGGNGGGISINASGTASSISVNGTIDAHGGQAGDGGSHGGNGGSNLYYFGQGGHVDLSVPYGALLVTGNIVTSGGAGGNGGSALATSGWAGGRGGDGGEGGSVYGSAMSIAVNGTITTTGGNGGNGGNGDGTGNANSAGNGGYGGMVGLTSYGGLIHIGSIDTFGAKGGNAGSGVAGYNQGGDGGEGGQINIVAYGGASVTVGSISAYGGNAGNGASGGDGGEGARVTISGNASSNYQNDGVIQRSDNAQAAVGDIQIGTVDVHGGNGGANFTPSNIYRGQGGSGGYINMRASGQVRMESLIGYGGNAGEGSGRAGGDATNLQISGGDSGFYQYDYSNPYGTVYTAENTTSPASSIFIGNADLRGGKGGSTTQQSSGAWGGDGGEGHLTANALTVGSFMAYGGDAGMGSVAGGGRGGSLELAGARQNSYLYNYSTGDSQSSYTYAGATGAVTLGMFDARGGAGAASTFGSGEGGYSRGGWLSIYANGNVRIDGIAAYGGSYAGGGGYGGRVEIAGGYSSQNSSAYDAASNTTLYSDDHSYSGVSGSVQIGGALIDLRGGSGADTTNTTGYGSYGGGSGGLSIFATGPVTTGTIATSGGVTDPDSGLRGASGGDVRIAGGYQYSTSHVYDNNTGTYTPQTKTETWQVSAGAITTGAIDSHGTSAGTSIYPAQDGGQGGSVILRGQSVSVIGDIASYGGAGGDSTAYGGGRGGSGGRVDIASSDPIVTGLIVTSGGAAGNGVDGGFNGSPPSNFAPSTYYYGPVTFGAAGDVTIATTGAVSINGIVANAGAGGNATSSAGMGGDAGLAGNINVTGANITINGPLMNAGASGGTGASSGASSANGGRSFTSSVFRYTNSNAPMGINQSFFTGISAPLLVLGNTATTPYLVVDGKLDLSGRNLSLLASGDIASSSGIMASGLNVDGGGVAITGPNQVANLQGRARTGNFVFENGGSTNLTTVDPGNGIPGVVAAGIAQISSTGDITSDIVGSNALRGGAVVLKTSGAIGNASKPLQVGTTVLQAVATTGASIELNSLNPAFSAVDQLLNTGSGDILLLAHGGVKTTTTVKNLGGDVHIKTFSPLQVLDGASAAGAIALETSGSTDNTMLLNGTFSAATGFKVIIGTGGLLAKGPAFNGAITEQVGGANTIAAFIESASNSESATSAVLQVLDTATKETNLITQKTDKSTSGSSGTVTDQDEKKEKEKEKKGLGVCKP